MIINNKIPPEANEIIEDIKSKLIELSIKFPKEFPPESGHDVMSKILGNFTTKEEKEIKEVNQVISIIIKEIQGFQRISRVRISEEDIKAIEEI